MPELRSLVKNYLKEAKLMQLATCLGDKPWVCTVWFAADDDLNIYYFSSTSRRHSKEIMKNSNVSGAMTLPQTPADMPRGIQFEGEASVLDQKKDVERAISVYAVRIFSIEKIRDFMKNKDHKFYRIRPSLFVLFDPRNFPDNPRQELRL